MEVATLVPGHGPIGNRQSIVAQRKYLAALVEGVKAGIRDGRSPDAVAQSLDLTGFHPNGEDVARNQASVKAVYAKLNR